VSLRTKILGPILAAIIVVAALLGFLWLERSQALLGLGEKLRAPLDLAANLTQSSDDAWTGDRALLHLRQGDLLALSGDWQGAEKEYRQSVDADGGVMALKKLVTAQLQRRDIAGAEGTVERLRREGARAEDILLLDVSIALRKNEPDAAKDLLSEAGDSPQKHYGAALLAIVSGDHATAQEELKAVEAGWDPVLRAQARTLLSAYEEYDLFPESTATHLLTLLSRALAQVQECEIALPLLTNVTAQQDDYRDAWIVKGYCELVTERYEPALASLERAYALDPEKPEIQYFLGRTYAALKDYKNAETFLQYALRNGFQPEREVRRAIAASALASGNTSLAFDQYRELATASGSDLASIEKFVGLALQAGKNDEAHAAAVSATERWPDSGKAFSLLGYSAAAKDLKDEARTAFTKALELDPTLDDVKQKLVDL